MRRVRLCNVFVPLLVSGVALMPIGAQLHSVVASHAHVFCADHQRIEDVSLAVLSGPFGATEQTEASADHPSLEGTFCSLSNSCVQLSVRVFTGQGCALPTGALGFGCGKSSQRDPFSVLMVAPKNSPPPSMA